MTIKLRFLVLMFLLSVTTILRAQQPNILLIVSDDLNTRIGPYMELDKHTPNLDRLANSVIGFGNGQATPFADYHQWLESLKKQASAIKVNKEKKYKEKCLQGKILYFENPFMIENENIFNA